MRTCKVCNSNLKEAYGKCDYCGYSNAPVMTLDANDKEEYVNGLLSCLSDFSFHGRKVQFDKESTKFINKGYATYLITDKISQIDKIYMCTGNNWVAHPYDNEAEISVKISYRFNNSVKKITERIRVTEVAGTWYIGVSVDSSLRLAIYIGVSDSLFAGKVKHIPLELHE